MRVTWRDSLATILVMGVVVLYVGYLTFGSMPLVNDVRGMAGIGMILGWGSRVIGGRAVFGHGWAPRLASLGGILSLAVGGGVLVTQNAGLLAVFVGSIVLLWGFAVVAHLYSISGPDEHATASDHRHGDAIDAKFRSSNRAA